MCSRKVSKLESIDRLSFQFPTCNDFSAEIGFPISSLGPPSSSRIDAKGVLRTYALSASIERISTQSLSEISCKIDFRGKSGEAKTKLFPALETQKQPNILILDRPGVSEGVRLLEKVTLNLKFSQVLNL